MEVLCKYGHEEEVLGDSSSFGRRIIGLKREEVTWLVVLRWQGMREVFDSRPQSATYPFPQPSPATTTANDFDEPLGPCLSLHQ